MNIRDFDPHDIQRDTKETNYLDITSTPGGIPIRQTVLTIGGAEPGPVLLVSGGVHGDEFEGPLTIVRLFEELKATDITGTFVGLAVANVPAFETATRSSPIDGLNLARVLPGKAEGSLTERIGYWLTEKLMAAGDLFIDLHSGGVALNIPTSIYYCLIDNEQGRKTREAAFAFGAPVIIGSDASKGVWGCSFRTTWDRGIPGIFTEGPGGGRTRPEDVHCYAQGVINVMRQMKMLAGVPEPQPTTHHLVGDGQPGGGYLASVAGYFRSDVAPLDHVTVGQMMGAIQGFDGSELQTFVAQREGYVSMLRAVPRVSEGDAVISITGGQALS